MAVVKYANEEYLRAEHLLKDGRYLSCSLEVESVVEGCPLQRKLKPSQGYGLRFKGKGKILGLGATNFSLMCAVAGDSDPSTWAGKVVRLEVRRVRAQTGGTQPAIRIIPPDGTELRSGLVKELGERYEQAKA